MEPLTAEEVRVAGCLVEKEATVPEAYPLTLNALRAACNQTSSRDPVTAYDDRIVQTALDSLKARRLVRFVHPAQGSRTTRYRHVLDEALDLDRAGLALLAVLMLRGPQTAGELRQRTERMHAFGSLAEAEATLASLAGRPEPLVALVPRGPGQKDDRWAQLLAGEPAPQPAATTADGGGGHEGTGGRAGPGVVTEAPFAAAADQGAGAGRPPAEPAGRLDRLERDVADLRRLVLHLYAAMGEDPPDEVEDGAALADEVASGRAAPDATTRDVAQERAAEPAEEAAMRLTDEPPVHGSDGYLDG